MTKRIDPPSTRDRGCWLHWRVAVAMCVTLILSGCGSVRKIIPPVSGLRPVYPPGFVGQWNNYWNTYDINPPADILIYERSSWDRSEPGCSCGACAHGFATECGRLRGFDRGAAARCLSQQQPVGPQPQPEPVPLSLPLLKAP